MDIGCACSAARHRGPGHTRHDSRRSICRTGDPVPNSRHRRHAASETRAGQEAHAGGNRRDRVIGGRGAKAVAAATKVVVVASPTKRRPKGTFFPVPPPLSWDVAFVSPTGRKKRGKAPPSAPPSQVRSQRGRTTVDSHAELAKSPTASSSSSSSSSSFLS